MRKDAPLHRFSSQVSGFRVRQGGIAILLGWWFLCAGSGPLLAQERGRLLAERTTWVNAVAFSPDGLMVAIGDHDGVVTLIPLKKGAKPTRLEAKAGWVNCLAYSPDGTELAVGYCQPGEWRTSTPFIPGVEDRSRSTYSLRVWDLKRPGQSHTLQKGLSEIRCLAYSPDGKILAVGAEEDVVLWETKTNRERGWLRRYGGAVLEEDPKAPRFIATVSGLAFSPDGQVLATRAGESVVRLWDLVLCRPVAALRGCGEDYGPVAFSPDGRFVAASAFRGKNKLSGEIMVWDAHSGRLARTIIAHKCGVHSLAFSPQGWILASASGEGVIGLWDTRTGQNVCSWPGHVWTVKCLAFSPDGTSLLTGGEDRTARLWNVPETKGKGDKSTGKVSPDSP
jgi:WD40 repeat protein